MEMMKGVQILCSSAVDQRQVLTRLIYIQGGIHSSVRHITPGEVDRRSHLQRRRTEKPDLMRTCEAMEEAAGLLFNLLMLLCAGLLLLRAAEGRALASMMLLVCAGVTLSCCFQCSALKLGVMGVLGAVVHSREKNTRNGASDQILKVRSFTRDEDPEVDSWKPAVPLFRSFLCLAGCDSGFGLDLAWFLTRVGFRVFAGVLDESSPGALSLKEAQCGNLSVIQMDVTDSRQISLAYQQIHSQIGQSGKSTVTLKYSPHVVDGFECFVVVTLRCSSTWTGLWALVNNAGVLGYVCDGEILPISLYRKQLDVNFMGSVEVTKTFLPLIRRAKGRIISITSMGGEVPLAGFAGYGASKAALTVFNGVIRQELCRWGVKVINIQPGAFKTNIFGSREHWDHVHEEIFGGLSPEVKDSYGEVYLRSMQQRMIDMCSVSSEDKGPFLEDLKHAILSQRPKAFYYPGKAAWAIPVLYRHCPTVLSDRILKRLFKSTEVKPAEL
ncbi:hypothetical protein DNTS_011920 [Danionella cerebrum]|uniref:Estradiol 17-beta-dehydrogenase 2 n=1 Tax=Danionella cerebrum TaxID=2873325 RepID=A0A553Q7I7_9TELE|nr:hypothetical protein DNTS_011920 [Danionella translucida]